MSLGTIQTNIGLITGRAIGEIVDSLMELASRPRDLLISRTNELQSKQSAVTALTASLVSVQYVVKNLGKADIFNQRKAESSNSATLAVTTTGTPPLGTYKFTPLRTVQNHQLLSSGFKSDTDPLGGGKLTFRFGDHVQHTASLGLFDGGEGVTRGKICITDRSGDSAEIDLSTIQTVDDVLDAINSETTINVTAVAHGDCLRIVDNTGQTASNLKVEEVGGGSTAASLGLAGIDVAADTADGSDMIRLYEDIDLDELNDGNGVRRDTVLPDIEFTLADGTAGEIDLSPIESGSSNVIEEFTLGEILDVINEAAPGKLKAEIAPDGDRLVITDLTTGSETFELCAMSDSYALADLGLDTEAVGGVITGRRLLGGAGTVLLSSLDGGVGPGTLGSIQLTDRSGAADSVDLADAETLNDVIQAVNNASVGILAQVNRARNGIELIDTTGSSAGNLIVANTDATNTADKLGIAVDDGVDSIDSGDMHLQVVAMNTLLDDLNGGAGVARGTLKIRDSAGNQSTLDLRDDDIQTVGDVIKEINRLELDIYAEINPAGDGIRIVDTAGGELTLSVEEGSSNTARDLHLLGDMEEVEIGGQTHQVVDGSNTQTVELGEDDSLSDLIDKINELNAGVTAMLFNDGSSKPYRLSVASDCSGLAGELVFDTSQITFDMDEMVKARDALLIFGDADQAATNMILSSSTNTFADVLTGVTLEIKQASDQPVTVTVSSTETDLVASLSAMVNNYNNFREQLSELTAYNAETDTRSILTGDSTALRLDTDLSYLLSGSFAGAGSIRSLAAVGVSFNDDGTLKFDQSKLKAKYAEDPDAVEAFFTTEDFGFAEKFDRLLERISGEEDSLLGYRIESLQNIIAENQQRIAWMNKRLEVEQERLLIQFYNMEIAIGKMQNSLSIVEALKPLTPLFSTK